MSKLQSALDLAGKGFRVFPLEINGKTPAITGDWKVIATTDPDKIRELWTCPVFGTAMDYNIGIRPDPDLLVVDVDVRDGKKGRASLNFLEAVNDPLPATLTVITASGGEHRYFKTPRHSATFPAHLAEHIDLKGADGYVVGPGSSINERAYRTRSEGGGGQIADAPGWLCDLPASKRHDDRGRMVAVSGDPVVTLDAPDAIKRAVDWLTTSAPDSGTFKVACRLKDFGVSQDTATDLLEEHWAGAGSRDHDHIAFRVANAYRYGQNAPGVRSPEAEFDAVEVDASVSKPLKRGLYAIRWNEAKPVLDRPYLIDDIFDLGSMAVTYGDSNVGKTYIVLDQARAIAAGADWNGHKVKQGLVVYVAAEGGTGFYKRIEAYRRTFGATNLPFSLVPCPIDLHSTGDSGDTDRLVRLIRAEEAHFGVKCVLVVVDTLARAMGGGDENTSVDMGLLVRHCDRIRAATGATINLIHHTGKDKAKGARGSSALRAATDTEIEIDAGVVSVQKQRDMAKAASKHFQLKPVEVGQRPDGRAVTSCVVEWVAASEFEDRISPAAAEMLAVLEEIVAARQEEGEGDGSVDWPDWQDAALLRLKGPRGKALKRTALFPLRKELHDAGAVAKGAGATWRLKSDNPDKN